MKKLFVLLVVACMATVAFGNTGDPIVKSNSKSPVKTGINIGAGGVKSNSKSSLKKDYKTNNNQFQKRKYHKIFRSYKRQKFWNKIF